MNNINIFTIYYLYRSSAVKIGIVNNNIIWYILPRYITSPFFF